MDFEMVSNQNNKFGRYVAYTILCYILKKRYSLSPNLYLLLSMCATSYIRYYSIARLKRKEILTLANIDVGIDIDSLEILCSRYGRYHLLVDGTFYLHSFEIYCCSRTSKIALKTQFSHNSSSEQDMHKM